VRMVPKLLITNNFILLTLFAAANLTPAQAAKFTFGSNQNALTGLPSKTLSDDGFNMLLSVGFPAGAVFCETDSRGVSIRSQDLPDVIDEEGADKINLLSGTGVPPGSAESVEFSFDKPGVLTELDFDGVKDEAYEYFLFQTATSPDLYFFDSFIGTMGGDPGLIDVPGQVVFLQEEVGNAAVDDKSFPLHIPFAAGQLFTITYGQLNGIQDGQLTGNGARFQGLTVHGVPEPATGLLAILGGVLMALARRREF